jgi:hypothetical protein
LDILSFIDSPDVSAYCREINHEFTTFEMAVVIGYSERTMAEQHTAWRELITDYPDMLLPTGSDDEKDESYGRCESLHQKLREFIDYEERLLALFKSSESGAIYAHNINGEVPRTLQVLKRLWLMFWNV